MQHILALLKQSIRDRSQGFGHYSFVLTKKRTLCLLKVKVEVVEEVNERSDITTPSGNQA